MRTQVAEYFEKTKQAKPPTGYLVYATIAGVGNDPGAGVRLTCAYGSLDEAVRVAMKLASDPETPRQLIIHEFPADHIAVFSTRGVYCGQWPVDYSTAKIGWWRRIFRRIFQGRRK